MDPRLANIQQLVAESTYPIDENVIAEAILVRAAARRLVPDLASRRAPAENEVRSFRPHRGARSFRLARARRWTEGRREPPVWAAVAARGRTEMPVELPPDPQPPHQGG